MPQTCWPMRITLDREQAPVLSILPMTFSSYRDISFFGFFWYGYYFRPSARAGVYAV